MSDVELEEAATREDEEHGDPEHRGEHEPDTSPDDEPDTTPDGEPDTTPDGEPDTSSDGEPEPTPQPAGSTSAGGERAIEAATKALTKEEERHAKRVAEIVGAEDFEILQRCPLCPSPFPGYRWPVPPPPEVIALVKEAIGEPAQPDYRADAYSKVCEQCDGLGAVSTGSRVTGQTTARCIPCDGRGWVPIGPERQGGAIVGGGNAPPLVTYTPEPPPAVEPPEVTKLKELGYIIVAPIEPPSSAT